MTSGEWKLIACIAFTAMMMCSCDSGSDYRYMNVDGLKRSESAWMSHWVPEDAYDIRIWQDPESRLVRASYKHDQKFPVRIVGMTSLDKARNVLATSSYPELKGREMNVQFRCESKRVRLRDQSVEYLEVHFVGDAGAEAFYWNSTSSDAFRKLCGS